MNIRKNIILRVYLAFFMLAIVAVGILGRVFQLQNIQGEKWRKLSDSLTTKLVNVPAIRGNIYSSDGSLLATSLPEYELRFDLMAEKVTDEIFNSKVDSLAYCLADLFKDKTAADYERKMIAARNHKERYYLLKRNVTYLELKKIRTFPIFRLGKNKGGLLFIQKNKSIQPFITNGVIITNHRCLADFYLDAYLFSCPGIGRRFVYFFIGIFGGLSILFNRSIMINRTQDRKTIFYYIKSLGKTHGNPGCRLGLFYTNDDELKNKILKMLPVWNINSFGQFYP